MQNVIFALKIDMATETLTYSTLMRQIQAGRLSPVYILFGEEGFYIDELVKQFEQVLSPEERDFNQYILYASDTSADTVIDTCRRYPMMSDRQVVILKEVQTQPAEYMNRLSLYFENPNPTTLLVVVFRGERLKGKNVADAIKKGGCVTFESRRLTDYNIGAVLQELIRECGMNVDAKALEMLKEYVGTDLSRLYNEIGKLGLVLPKGAMITPEVVERNIGVSKDYNSFEFTAAVARKDMARAIKINSFFRRDPKNKPTMGIVPNLFNLFVNLLIVYYTPDKSDRGLMSALGFKSPYQLKDVKAAMQNYSAWQCIEIIGEIRRFDAMSKGNGSRMDQYDLLDSLLFRIFNARGAVTQEG